MPRRIPRTQIPISTHDTSACSETERGTVEVTHARQGPGKRSGRETLCKCLVTKTLGSARASASTSLTIVMAASGAFSCVSVSLFDFAAKFRAKSGLPGIEKELVGNEVVEKVHCAHESQQVTPNVHRF